MISIVHHNTSALMQRLYLCVCNWYHKRLLYFFFFSSRRRHTRFDCDWSSDVCSSDLNTLSFASVPTILRKGPAWFASLGPPNSGGTVIYSISGHVEKPRNIELPLGVPFADLLELCGGVRGGRKLKAVIPGGVSVPVVPGDIMLKTRMDYDSVKAAGSAL